MKLTIERKALAEAVGVAKGFLNPRSPLPIVQTIKLVATAQTLTLEATNLETSGTVIIPADVSELGAVCIPGALLAEMVGRFPAGELTIETLGEGRCSLSCKGSRYELSILPAEEWPETRLSDVTSSATMPQAVLAGLIAQATVAAAKTQQEARAVMTGVLVTLDLDRLTMTSTDGRRLAHVEEVVSLSGDSGNLSAVIPAEALRQLSRVLGKTGEVTLTTTGRDARFTLPGYEFRAQLLEGCFPDASKVIPSASEADKTARLGVSDLVRAIKRLLPLAQEKRSPGLLRLSFAAGGLHITANTPDVGSGEERVECQFEGEPLTIGFNGNYLLDGLSVLDQDGDVEIEMRTDTKSAVLHAPADRGFLYVAMPVKLRDVAEDYERQAA